MLEENNGNFISKKSYEKIWKHRSIKKCKYAYSRGRNLRINRKKWSRKNYINKNDKQEFEETADIIAGIKRIIAGNLKGNPRQAKRFLNTYITKKKLAELYFGTDEDALDTRVLAKLLVLQKLDGDLFIQLNEWNKKFTTENEDFKAMFESIEFTINPHFIPNDLKPFIIFASIPMN